MKQSSQFEIGLQRLFAITLLVIVYGSLYPFQFYHPVPPPANLLSVLWHSWPALSTVDTFLLVDIVVNLLIYAPLGAFAYLLCRRTQAPALSAAGPILLAFVLSGSLEITQLFIRDRVCSGLDLAANVAGAAMGQTVAALFEHYRTRARRRLITPFETARPSAAFLALCWISLQCFPFIPEVRPARLVSKLASFAAVSAIQPIGLLTVAIQTLAAITLFHLLFLGPTQRKVAWVAAAIVPLRLTLLGRTLDWSTAVGVLLACAAWLLVRSRSLIQPPVLAGLLAASVLLNGLQPFHFTTASQPFGWLPFSALLAGDWQGSFSILFQKLFTYGALIWFLSASGIRARKSALQVAAILAAIEIVQTHLPGRTAEISDPLIALLCALLFSSLDRTFGMEHNAIVSGPRADASLAVVAGNGE